MTDPGNCAELFDWVDLTGTGSTPSGSGKLLLVTTDDYLRPEIRDIAERETVDATRNAVDLALKRDKVEFLHSRKCSWLRGLKIDIDVTNTQ